MLTTVFRFAIVLGATLCSILDAQTAPYSAFVTGTGYVIIPQIHLVAPGQVTTFFVAGLPQTASGLKNVIAVVTIQGVAKTATVLSAKPLDDVTVAVTVQIPFDAAPVTDPLIPSTAAYSIQFGETGNAAAGPCGENVCTPPIQLVQIFSQPHVISTCDIFYSDVSTGCQQVVMHQNGQLVTVDAPAAAGEIVTLWALGLGAPAGGIPAGATGPIAMNDIVLQTGFISTTTILSSSPSTLAVTPYQFAGLPSPAVGLYQINFAIPQPPPNTANCVTATTINPNGLLTPGFSIGNFYVSLGRKSEWFTGFVSATVIAGGVFGGQICVAVPAGS